MPRGSFFGCLACEGNLGSQEGGGGFFFFFFGVQSRPNFGGVEISWVRSTGEASLDSMRLRVRFYREIDNLFARHSGGSSESSAHWPISVLPAPARGFFRAPSKLKVKAPGHLLIRRKQHAGDRAALALRLPIAEYRVFLKRRRAVAVLAKIDESVIQLVPGHSVIALAHSRAAGQQRCGDRLRVRRLDGASDAAAETQVRAAQSSRRGNGRVALLPIASHHPLIRNKAMQNDK